MKFIVTSAMMLVACAVFYVSPIVALAQQAGTYGPHMWGGGWWMFFGPFTMILFFGAIVLVVVLLVRWLDGSRRDYRTPSSDKTALAILEERFARGEIDKEEFEERRRILSE